MHIGGAVFEKIEKLLPCFDPSALQIKALSTLRWSSTVANWLEKNFEYIQRDTWGLCEYFRTHALLEHEQQMALDAHVLVEYHPDDVDNFIGLVYQH